MKEEIEKLKLEKVMAVEEAKKEADKLMMNKITMYENKLAKYDQTEEITLWDNTEINLPLEKDYQYQMDLLKRQLQMVLDDERGDLDLCKQIEVLTIENNILKEKNKFLNDTIKDIGILTKE